MSRYYTFFTNLEDREEMGGSHFNLRELSRGVEFFLDSNPKRQFLAVTICREEEDGGLTELVRWNKGSSIPVFDIREEEEMQPLSKKES